MAALSILYAASEIEPFAKSGGLADVAGSLPKALQRCGFNISLIMPKYSSIPQKYVEKMEYVGYVYIDMAWRHQYCGIFKLIHDGVTVYFLDNEYYFGRKDFYGYPDEAERFAFFSKAILEVPMAVGFRPDIIHLNDWQTAVVSVLLNAQYRHINFYKNIKTVFTIHNLKYQGVFPMSVMDGILGLDWSYFNPDGIEFHGNVNFMKAGIAYSDIITTVSKTYAEEIKYDYFGENLNDLIAARSNDLYGIVNGIDMEANNPETDTRIFTNFSVKDLKGKLVNKHMLQESLGLPKRSDIPVIGIISRLVDQKGFDLIAHVIEDIMKLDMQLIVLGTGDDRYHEMFKWAAGQYPGKVSANLKYDGLLAQRIYAGSDIFLMPSLFEPCGLSQIFSLRYGTIPVVRETGGLKDTVVQYNEITSEGNGFTFEIYNAHEMLYALKQAVHFYYHRSTWVHLMKKGMSQDFSWEKSAAEYGALYKKLKRK